MTEYADAIVIGATIRGLVTAYLLGALGYRVVLVERSSAVGGADGSFTTAGGNVFDHGFHVLDEVRSEITTRLFIHALDGRVRRTTLRRGIVIAGHLMPYAPEPKEMPPPLRAMLLGDDLVDEIGDELPTRNRIAQCYGAAFADLIFDEVLPSYPSEARHLTFGADEATLLTNIYPWFLPRAPRPISDPDESRAFHDQLRRGVPQTILYPDGQGFGAFAQGVAGKIRGEIMTGADDLELNVSPGTHSIESVHAGGRRFEAGTYFWAGGWAPLCERLGIECQDVATDRVALGSFRLSHPADTGYHEILIGDPQRWINRVSFPGAFRGVSDPLVQVEFAFPDRDPSWPRDADTWRERWWDDLAHLGVVGPTHEALDYDFRSFAMHFNGFGAEGEPLRDADPSLIAPGSNLVPLAPSMANLNLNRYVPRVVSDVVRVMVTKSPSAPDS